MNLKYIMQEQCSVCGAVTVAESIEGRHTNGQDREVRAFACNAKIEWCPNGSRLVVRQKCPNSKEYQDERDVFAINDLLRTLQYGCNLHQVKKEKVKALLVSLYPEGYKPKQC